MGSWPALDIERVAHPADAPPRAPEEWSELIHTALARFDIAAVHETSPERWRVFFHTSDARDRARAHLAAALADVAARPVDVDADNWAARSQAELQSVRVGRVIVAPPWDVPVIVAIQPSMGFGTGHHATTRLCLAALQRLDLRGRTVIDVGTGSGVLAIAASRLGAANVIGIDNDPDAIEAARENLRLNPEAEVTFDVADVRDRGAAWADVVLANLTGGLLIAASEHLRRLTADAGRLILSGFMAHEEREVLAAFAGQHLEHRNEEEGWVCVTLR